MTEPEQDEAHQGPPLPPSRPSWLALGYGVLGAIVLGIYLLAGVRGWHFFEADRDELPSGVRHAPGGYRSYSFWHVGYQGGK
jgi:hypothetical protein